MSDKQDLSELLLAALNNIEEMGGPERAQLAEIVGRPAYDRLTSGTRGADLVERWVAAGGKTKPAATKALSIYIAKIADKPDLVDRITREIGDSFEIDLPLAKGAGASPEARQRAPDEKQANPVNFKIVADSHIRKKDRNGQKPKADIATIAKSDDMKKYYAVRQRLQKSEL
jgi:hypothetical protein